ncbi:glycogen/starch/alpha-glucan phosphorylase [Psychromonas sp. Urea-02u-13]|uniref:glycogen/starch/alpha-glucan phosphorylase n=1 Tax=Psychromonas sp. Urea-02u-13 TaxID=2058326 RepID=UPI000C33C1D1|nr:glycogen/starch/alpha-glucan phosphorylase [Psychromonas sp. Urea-02u-13]PKG38591.1 glycogen phosphorylase [Psychromonas sp. Urea-02u-13]
MATVKDKAAKKTTAKKTTAKKVAPAKSASKKATPVKASPAIKCTTKQMQDAIVDRLHKGLGTDSQKANNKAWWNATCYAVNELVFDKLTKTQQSHCGKDTRAVNYLSLEFLMGRLLSNNLQNLELFSVAEDALKALGKDIYEVCDEEPDMALGNGGLGRLAACFIDSLATLGYPAIGYGIHYEHGLFSQSFQDGHQIERPDTWREYGNPWEICRPESIQHVPLYGYVETVFDKEGGSYKVWHAGQKLKGVPWDIPIVGYGAKTVNILRLWESRADEAFDWDVFNAGGYVDAQAEKSKAETVSKVLYPNDTTEAGKELRLIQQYFFCACSVKDILRRFKRANSDWSLLPEKVAIQLNDTHPTIAIPELMRILVDEERLDWDFAWSLCQQTFAYTNHTLLPEALEKWTVGLFEKVLPRHLEIIYEINHQFLKLVEQKWPGDQAKKEKLSVIEEGGQRLVRMANLCVITAYKVNGVAAVHSALVKTDLFPEFHELFPTKLVNVTNGVTPRRWLKACNPKLAGLYDETVGADWVVNLDKLKDALPKAKDVAFQKRFMDIKQENKVALVKVIKDLTDIDVSPDAIFDIQIKRLHEYKRQQLNLIHILTLYKRLLENPDYDMVPRVFLFGAKAAPGYHMAKQIIFALNKIADKVNNDDRIKGKLKVVFLPNYRVSLAEVMIPAADVSEQISTAGLEASGTGNMKLALNGALTVGTMDGANIEMAEEIGAEHMFIFGLSVAEVKALKASGYNPYDYYYNNPELKSVLDWLDSDFFTPGQPGALSDIKRSLLDWGDEYLCLADYESYVQAHQAIDDTYRNKPLWAQKAIINSASMGKFNSDRSIEDYASTIWKLTKHPLK